MSTILVQKYRVLIPKELSMSSTSLYGEARLKLHYLLGSHTSCGLEVYEPAALGMFFYWNLFR